VLGHLGLVRAGTAHRPNDHHDPRRVAIELMPG
jgi:hypothetical protein